MEKKVYEVTEIQKTAIPLHLQNYIRPEQQLDDQQIESFVDLIKDLFVYLNVKRKQSIRQF